MKAISSMATRQVLSDLADAAVAAGLPQVSLESVGGVIAEERVIAGESFELVLLASGALKRLATGGYIDPLTVTPLVLSQVAIAVPDASVSAAERPTGAAFADAAGVRAAVQEATRIGYSTGPSGTAVVKMIDDWGLTAEVGDRLVQAQAGVPVAASLAAGDVDLGFQQLSELVGQPGIRILGVMPADCAIDTVFAGAVASVATDPERAAAVLAFFASDEVVAITEKHNFGRP